MTRGLRLAHYYAIGTQAVGVVLFAWLWSTTGEGLWAALVGWCCFFGASHVMTLRADRKKGGGVKV